MLRKVNLKAPRAKVMSGVVDYQNAIKECKQLLSSKEDLQHSWMNEVLYFQELRQLKYSIPGELKSRNKKQVDSYMSGLWKKWKKCRSLLEKEKFTQMEKLQEDWIEKYGDVPPSVSELLQRFENLNVNERGNYTWSSLIAASKTSAITNTNKKISELSELLRRRTPYDEKVSQISKEYEIELDMDPSSIQWREMTETLRLLRDRNTILFSIDIEAYEVMNSVITEIGICIYDPRENQNTLTPLYRTFHLCPSESLDCLNLNYVPEHKKNFLVGESQVLPLVQCVDFIQGLVNYYLRQGSDDDKYTRAIVGHGIASDLRWLERIFIKLPSTSGKSSRVRLLDTASICQNFYGKGAFSLAKALRLHDIPHSYLHNAGNDAYYTLQLLMNMTDIDKREALGWDNISAIRKKLRRWEKDDSKCLTYTDGTPYDGLSKRGGSGGKGSRRGKPRNWSTHFRQMAYHDSIASYIERFHNSEV
ncbi:HCL650Wp [Eremothecium sinecaudum]|uniref:HCL650Wp n=1 Tax=Eremothecium sinecaudum TaxID=45286 RepID=A0A120K1M3_9SACH|nr:HCL650Wp [Eremothecium sinecaudum]AMD19501.1 HCL650Wp [Eremothecium sinecaudum]